MDSQCKLTVEQLQALIDGRTIWVSYVTLEEYGYVAKHKIELIPPDKLDGGVQPM